MNQNRQPRSNAGQLPRSVKVRSTCNACQQAKIRCSHEKPSCRRCQKHKIECIYSVSRRLGRPAKKESKYMAGSPNDVSAPGIPGAAECGRKARKPAKKKNTRPYTRTKPRAYTRDSGKEQLQKLMKPVSGPEVDRSSESWLQALTPTREDGAPTSSCLESAAAYGDIELEAPIYSHPELSGYLSHSVPTPQGGFPDLLAAGLDSTLLQSYFEEASPRDNGVISMREQLVHPAFADDGTMSWTHDSISSNEAHKLQVPTRISNRDQLLLTPSPMNQCSSFPTQPSFFDSAMLDSEQVPSSFIYIRSKVILGKIELDEDGVREL